VRLYVRADARDGIKAAAASTEETEKRMMLVLSIIGSVWRFLWVQEWTEIAWLIRQLYMGQVNDEV
jgi:hypothetical protein